MKKLILQEFISADGFCADREKTTGFFDGTYNNIGNEITPHQEKLMGSIDLILLGKETYKMFTNYWPDAGGEDSKIAEAMNRLPKIVFSGSLQEVQWGNHGNISLVTEDAITYITSLKQKEEKNMIMWGSISLAQSLLKANLIDEIQLVVVPVAIGKGYSLFPEDFKLFHLALSDHKIFSNGVALLTYKPQEVLRPI
ncbi:dihydrofolate reductase family protein [Chryseobacterium gallinarum]|uniref:Dihydrofolate reductase family protein n=1 Tax=Chryseobacterium gallinarum TaxID=1324352 RepID=A0ABX6KLF6_CHRGL|nr:dihydrofolate reductase family protein [Chryseobacterium gallinarum]QIY89491.1 dihydrofolate reductase family protein [Chryseobacterium gallinarum]